MHKAIEIWEEAAELGGIRACYTLGEIYARICKGCVKDWKKAFQYHAKAAKGGHDLARYALGVLGNYHKIKAMKHMLIGTASGNDEVKQGFAGVHTMNAFPSSAFLLSWWSRTVPRASPDPALLPGPGTGLLR